MHITSALFHFPPFSIMSPLSAVSSLFSVIHPHGFIPFSSDRTGSAASASLPQLLADPAAPVCRPIPQQCRPGGMSQSTSPAALCLCHPPVHRLPCSPLYGLQLIAYDHLPSSVLLISVSFHLFFAFSRHSGSIRSFPAPSLPVKPLPAICL